MEAHVAGSPADRRRSAADRHADRDLASPLFHRGRHHAVQPEARQQEGGGGEGG